MECYEDKDKKAAGVQNILQRFDDNEFQHNTVSSTDNRIVREPDELTVVNLDQQNTNFTAKTCCIDAELTAEFVEREYIGNEKDMGTLNFLKTLGTGLNKKPTLTSPTVQNFDRIQVNENIFNAIPKGEGTLCGEEITNSLTTVASYEISINANLDSYNTTSEYFSKNNRPIRLRTSAQENDNIPVTTTVQQCDLVSSSEINVEGENVRLGKLHSPTHLCTYYQGISNCSDSTRQTDFMGEKGEETDINRTNETKESSETQKVDQVSIKSALKIYEGSSSPKIHLIKPQNLMEQQNNQQMSDPCSEFMDTIKNSEQSQKRIFSTIFTDNEQQFFKANMLRSYKIKNCGSSSKRFIQTTHLSPNVKSLKTHKIHPLNQPSTSNLRINPLKKHETNTYSPQIDWSFIRNVTETVDCKILTSETEHRLVGTPIMNFIAPTNTRYLLRTEAEKTDERNTLVTTPSQQHELDSSTEIIEERKAADLHVLGKSANLCTSDKCTSNDSGITTHLTDFKGDPGAEIDMNQRNKTLISIETQVHPPSIKSHLTPYMKKSPEQTHPIKPLIFMEQQRYLQMSDSCNDFMNIIENSKTALKRKISTILFDTEQQYFKASMLRSCKIPNRGRSPKHFNQTTRLDSKTKSLQLCNKLAVTKPSTSTLFTNSTNLEIDKVLQSESDARILERDERIDSNKKSEYTATISDDNGLVCYTEDYSNAHKSKSDGVGNSLPFNGNKLETTECTTLTSEKGDKPVDAFTTYPIATESPSRNKEYETNPSNISSTKYDETKSHVLVSSQFNGEIENIAFGSCVAAEHNELKNCEIRNNILEETCNFSTNSLSEEPIWRQHAKSNSLPTVFFNIPGSETTHKLIKIYIENLRVRRFTVQNVVNFITEQDSSISYFNAMHATRIFLKNALKNEILRMNNGSYLIKTSTENPPCSAETHARSTKTKRTLKGHLKKTINRNYAGIQTITPYENNILLENKALESETSYKLIKTYIENLREQRFTVQDVVNFITEHDPSISYFNAMHATRIFLENAQGNEVFMMDNGNYLVKTTTENSPYSVGTHTNSFKAKSTLKSHLKEIVNRNYAGNQTIISHDNNIPFENKSLELASEDLPVRNLTGFLETYLSGSGSPVLQDHQGSCNKDLSERK